MANPKNRSSDAGTRSLGLDIVRSLAILLVLVSHYSLFFSPQFNVTPVLYGAGYFGVELFFVLSGFLIGAILIRDVVPNPSAAGLLAFLKRRWLRTLPAYYLVWALILYQVKDVADAIPHLFMFQNWIPRSRDAFFGVSWSLVIEEWFYPIVPVVILALSLKNRDRLRERFFIACLIGVLVEPVMRLGEVLIFQGSYDDIRRGVWVRMDAPLYGVLLAAIREYRPQQYQLMVSHKRMLLLMAGVGLAFCASQFSNVQDLERLSVRTMLFSVAPLLFLPLIVALESESRLKKFSERGIGRAFKFVSLTSYAVYLTHWEVLQYFKNSFPFKERLPVAATIVISLVVTYIVALMLHNYWEKPFLRLRDRHCKS